MDQRRRHPPIIENPLELLPGLFAPGGELSAVEPGFEPRPQQTEMARAVGAALDGGGRLVVEAATGVGKSLAYLVPAALWAAAGGRRVVVSTHTRALQEQLIGRELPTVERLLKRLGVPFRFAVLMGADNYLCVQRLCRLRAAPELLEPSASALLEELDQWSLHASSARRSTLPSPVPGPLWSRVSRDPEVCLDQNGPYWSRCVYRKDQQAAAQSHILVVNHALLLSGARLPAADALIIDEAHSLEEAAVGRFGLAVSEVRVARLLAEIAPADGRRGFVARMPRLSEEQRAAARGASAKALARARAFFRRVAAGHGLKAGAAEPQARRFTEARNTLEAPLKGLEAVLESLESAAASAEEAAELKHLQLRVSGLRGELASFLSGESEATARWVEARPAGVELCAAPLEVGERLASAVWSRDLPVVLTSATLASGRGLAGFKKQIGLDGARELTLGTPFDFESQAALWIADDLPLPENEEAWASAVAQRCAEIVPLVPGGVFVLFSSWKALRRVHALLRDRLPDRPVWVQGSADPEALIEEFIRAGNAVLLGVDTFWQGIDVPGEALSCVVLTKLPFPPFASPIEEARREFFESLSRGYFEDHSLPRAVMKFRQGFGRLIRTTTDRGAVVVLDPRLAQRSYGNVFLEAIPRCRRLETLEDLGRFFGAKE